MAITTAVKRGMKLRAGTVLVARGKDSVQVGTDPRWSTELHGLAPGEIRWLEELSGRPQAAAAIVGERLRIPPHRQDEIMTRLAEAGFAFRTGKARSTTKITGNRAADTPALAALRPDGLGSSTMTARAKQSVALTSLDRFGATLASLLAAAGVGTMVLPDHSPVTEADLGPYPRAALGLHRNRVLSTLVHRSFPHCETLIDTPANFVIAIEDYAPHPSHYLELLGLGLPHLSVVRGEASITVGPLTVPGRTPCSHCLELWRQDDDASWPQTAERLRTHPVKPSPETVLTEVGAAMAVAQALAFLDRLTPVTLGAQLEIKLPQAIPTVRQVERHPGCGCHHFQPASSLARQFAQF